MATEEGGGGEDVTGQVLGTRPKWYLGQGGNKKRKGEAS